MDASFRILCAKELAEDTNRALQAFTVHFRGRLLSFTQESYRKDPGYMELQAQARWEDRAIEDIKAAIPRFFPIPLEDITEERDGNFLSLNRYTHIKEKHRLFFILSIKETAYESSCH